MCRKHVGTVIVHVKFTLLITMRNVYSTIVTLVQI